MNTLRWRRQASNNISSLGRGCAKSLVRERMQAQQRQLADIHNVYDKLAKALIDLLEELDLKRREESGLITGTLAGTIAAPDAELAKDLLADTISILEQFKRDWNDAGKKNVGRAALGLFRRVPTSGS